VGGIKIWQDFYFLTPGLSTSADVKFNTALCLYGNHLLGVKRNTEAVLELMR